MMSFSLLSKLLFTPNTMVLSTSSAGQEIITFFAPASKCFFAVSLVLKIPVHSSTKSTPKSFQGSSSGVFFDTYAMFFPSITNSKSDFFSIVPENTP